MTLAHYLLQVNIYLILFFTLYKILLAKETYFVMNRIYLVGGSLLSLFIPFIRIDWFKQQTLNTAMPVKLDQLDVMVGSVILQPVEDQFNWGGLVVTLYIIGIVLMVLKFVFKLIAVKQAFKNVSGGAFSFLNHKVVDHELPYVGTINNHEDVHVKQLHTLDILFFEFLNIINWFNPVVYLYKSEIKNVHEYLADEAAAAYQGNKELYAMLLLSQAFGVKPEALTNGFFTKSMIKKRIYMLHKTPSKRAAILKYGLSVPLFALALLFSSSTIRENEELLAVADEIPVEKAAAAVDYVKKSMVFGDVIEELNKVQTKKLVYSKKQAGWTDFYRYMGSSLRYPQGAANNEIEGIVDAELTISAGRIVAYQLKNGLGYGIDEELKHRISTYKGSLPQDGVYDFKTAFALVSDQDKTIKPSKNANIVIVGYRPKRDHTVYNFVSLENPPTYPGGMDKFYHYLGGAIKYPEEAAKNNIQGNVFVSFTVEIDGSLNDIKVERKLGYGTDEEAVRVLAASKRWNPGILNGEPVRVKYNIPIKFKIAEEPELKEEPALKLGAVKINGNRTPLYVLNGEIMDERAIETLNASHIESVSVLKDASATSLYGLKGANGVILITSKKQKTFN